ncbi:MAG: hypothetical protein ACKO1W_00440 [Microcystaceae cyanobacterium]
MSNAKSASKTTITPDVNPSAKKPWWQRGIFGPNGFIGKWFYRFFKGLFTQREIMSESSLFLYNRAMSDIRVLGKNAEIIDNEKFGKEEFLIFVKLKYLLRKNMNEYEGIADSIKLLQVAIDAKDSFIALYQTELSFRGSKQQDFYQYTEGLLSHYDNTQAFRDNVQVRLAETLTQIKTEEGRVALQAYAKHLDRLSERDLGLKLLSLFKSFQLADYGILRQISDVIQGLDKADLQSHAVLMSVVMANYNAFEKIARIISLPSHRVNPDTFARVVKYIALDYRYAVSFIKFDELMTVLKRWHRPYQTVIGIREAHPPHQFKQPEVFSEPLPGESTYFKYLKWLTDKKTGMIYVNFDDEES